MRSEPCNRKQPLHAVLCDGGGGGCICHTKTQDEHCMSYAPCMAMLYMCMLCLFGMRGAEGAASEGAASGWACA